MKRTLLLFLFFISSIARANDAATLLERSDAYRNPLENFAIDVELISHDGKRSETSRLRVHGKGADQSVVEFLAPAADKGRFLLMLRDAMWIYMPSASRPIRISPLQRLMGEASNGDVARAGFSTDYEPRSVAEEGRSWVLDLEAKDPSISYKRVRLWIDRETHRPLKAEFFVASGKLLKRAHYRDTGVMADHRIITEIEIEDVIRPGRRTVMRYSNLVARNNDDRMFTKEALAKW